MYMNYHEEDYMFKRSKRFNGLFKAAVVGSVFAAAASSQVAAEGIPEQYLDDPESAYTPVTASTVKPERNITFEDGSTKPNIIYITLDDIGFSDIGAYGAEIATPNIDALVNDGLQYTNFNAQALSSPTRASLLTGRESNSVGMGMVSGLSLTDEFPTLQGHVIAEAGTVAEILKANGYNTYGVGKWHLAPQYSLNPAGPFTYWPLSQGFDRYYGFMDGETSQFTPQIVDGNQLMEADLTAPGYSLNDDLLTHAKQYITDQVSIYGGDVPFFLDYSFGTGHSPHQVPESYTEMYKGMYDKGWDAVRQDRFERMLDMGILPEGTKLTDMPQGVVAWESLTADQKKLYSRFMEVYAGFMTQADEKVGELVQHLKDLGVYDNTMIILIGDNGATRDGTVNGTFSFPAGFSAGVKPTVEDLMVKYELIGTDGMQALYPMGWGAVGNTPFNTYKQSAGGGALRNPLIISWPKGISARGEMRDQYFHVTDITPTVLDVLHIASPEILDGIEQMPFYGDSRKDSFTDTSAPGREAFLTVAQFTQGYYEDGWKIISTHKNGDENFEDDYWQLFNVAKDYSESTDLAEVYPDKVEEMKAHFYAQVDKLDIASGIRNGNPSDMANVRPYSPADRSTFKYYPGVAYIGTAAAPNLSFSDVTITAPIERTSASDEGVLVAYGDEGSGYSFYIQDNKLVFYYNRFGTESKVVSTVDVPVGKSEVKFVLDTERPNYGGPGTLYINGEEVGTGFVNTTVMLTLEMFSIGEDVMAPVSRDYVDEARNFPFTGRYDYVEFDLVPFMLNAKK